MLESLSAFKKTDKQKQKGVDVFHVTVSEKEKFFIIEKYLSGFEWGKR